MPGFLLSREGGERTCFRSGQNFNSTSHDQMRAVEKGCQEVVDALHIEFNSWHNNIWLRNF